MLNTKFITDQICGEFSLPGGDAVGVGVKVGATVETGGAGVAEGVDVGVVGVAEGVGVDVGGGVGVVIEQ